MSSLPVAYHRSVPRRAGRPAPGGWLWALLFLAAAGILALYQVVPPAPLPESAPADQFSAARAMAHVQAIAQAPHPPGTAAHAAVRQYLIDQLKAQGLEPEVQQSTVITTDFGVPFGVALVHNVAARLPGTQPSKAVLLAAHYDSVPTSGGAADDSAGVAVLLETLRALKAAGPFRNDVIFLFTDGEELSLLGARAFVDEHPWAGDVGLAVNFEARGNAGPVPMFEVSAGNGRLMAEFARAVPQPFTTSLAYSVYQRMPNDTDITEFKRIPGVDYLNVAPIYGWDTYHTALDSVEHLSRGTLQQMGGYALGLAKHFGNVPLPVSRTPDAVWFNLFRWVLVRYPVGWVWPLALLTVAGLMAVLWVGFRRRALTAGRLGLGLLGPALALGLMAGVTWALRRWVMPGVGPWLPLFSLLFVPLGIAVSLIATPLLRRRATVAGLLGGAQLWWAILTLACAALLPGAAHVFTWPLLFSLPALLRLTAADDSAADSPGTVAWLSLWALPAVFLTVPLIQMLYAGLVSLPEVPTAILVLLLSLLAGHMAVLTGRGRWWLAGPVLALTVGIAVAGVALPPTANHPAYDGVVYGLDAATGKAWWFSGDNAPDEWTVRYLGDRPVTDAAKAFFPYQGKKLLTAPAPVAALPAPAADLVSDRTVDGVREAQVRITSPRGGAAVTVHMDARVEVLGATINDKPLNYHCKPAATNCMPWSIRFAGLPREGLLITFRVPAGQPLDLLVIDHSPGLPPPDGAAVSARPAHLLPGWGLSMTAPDDSTMVSQRFQF